LGQKTHPIGFRLGVIKSWNSKWFANKNFGDLIYEDLMIKKYISTRLDNAGLAKVEILRAPKKVTVDIHTSRPGIVIGRKGAEVDKLREELQLLTKKDISLNIIEVKKPELNARLVADSIAHQLEGRIAYRRAMKRAMMATMKMGADGIKIVCGGRLAGAEIARSEKYMQGRVPLHTLRADIDYATSTAHTTYGTIGVKVWICRGMIMGIGELGEKEEVQKPVTEQTDIEMTGKKDRRRREESRGKRRPRGRVRRPGDSGGREGGPEGRGSSGGRGDRSQGSDNRGPGRSGDRSQGSDNRGPSRSGGRSQGSDNRGPSSSGGRSQGSDNRGPSRSGGRRPAKGDAKDKGKRPEKASAPKPAPEKKNTPEPKDKGE